MNEKVAKKVGEAYAFALVFKELHGKTEEVLTKLLGERAAAIPATTTEQMAALNEVAQNLNALDVVQAKAERTAKKISEMGQFYVGEEWGDPAEVLEWLSFFFGAALIHWQLIKGCAEELGTTAFIAASTQGANYYAEMLELARVQAEEIGHIRARS